MIENAARLTGKIAVVTGGTQGLERRLLGFSPNAAAEGLVICGRNQDKGEAKAREIEAATGVRTVYQPADLERVEDARAVIARADQEFGRIDCLVNAAAITDRGNILDTSPELFDRMFAINVRAPFFLMQEAIGLMRREGTEGAIVQYRLDVRHGRPAVSRRLLRLQGRLGDADQDTAYAVLRNRIRVNGLNIGWMASEGEDRIQREFHGAPADWLDKAAAAQPFGRLVDPQEVRGPASISARRNQG